MPNPNEAWKTDGEHSWLQNVQKLAEFAAKTLGTDQVVSKAFRVGFKAGVYVADRCFCKKLAPEHRQN